MYFHWQVITRFIASSCPVIYWYVAMVTLPRQQLSTNRGSNTAKKVADAEADSIMSCSDFLSCRSTLTSRAVFVYFVLYLFVGTAAFVNFFPWT